MERPAARQRRLHAGERTKTSRQRSTRQGDYCHVWKAVYLTPDLPFRIRHDIALSEYDPTTFYAPETAAGYIDYPFCDEFVQLQMKIAAAAAAAAASSSAK